MKDGISFKHILGVKINAINMADVLKFLNFSITTKQEFFICVAPAHSIMDAYNDVELREIFNASGLTTPDGRQWSRL